MLTHVSASGLDRRNSAPVVSASAEAKVKKDRRSWISAALRDAEHAGLDRASALLLAEEVLDGVTHENGYEPTEGEARVRLVERVAAVVALHWLKRTDRSRSFAQVARTLRGRKSGVCLLAETILADGVARRDPKAVERFARDYGAKLARIGRGGDRVEQQLEGLLGEVFERPDRYLDGYRGEAELSGWLSRIARSAWIGATRVEARDERRRSKLARDRKELHEETPPTSDYEGCAGILAEISRQALDALSDRESLMLRMVMLDGLNQSEFAKIVGRDKATVTRWMTAAREKLGRRVGELLVASGRAGLLTEYLDSAAGALPADLLNLAGTAAEGLRRCS